MSEVTLSAAVRGSLLSLQGTTDLIERTQGRLSTGLKVASAIDDPVSFFQAKTLTDRASDFVEKKDSIDQGISTLAAAVNGVEAVETLVNQLKGVANSMKSATGTQFTDLITQFNDLRTQIDLVTTDATYQGTNLINGTGQTLSVEFSDKSTSKLTVSSVDITVTGASIPYVDNYNNSPRELFFNYNVPSASLSAGATLSYTYAGPDITITTASGTVDANLPYDNATLEITLTAGANSITLSQGTTYSIVVSTASTVPDLTGTTLTATVSGVSAGLAASSQTFDTRAHVGEGDSTSIDLAITQLNSALTTLRSESSTLGMNVALLQTRLDFTDGYVATLEEGGSKLTLADINEEGANLLALQTRQQLGVQSLSFAGQAEQSVLGLFR